MQIRNELHLHVCKLQKDKSADCPTLQTYGNNWGEILKRSLIKEHELSGGKYRKWPLNMGWSGVGRPR